MKFNFQKVVFTGDSLVDEKTNLIGHDGAINAGVGYDQWDSGSHWVYMLSRVFDFDYTNTGLCGEQIKNIYDYYLDERIMDYNPTFVFLDGGVNDASHGTSINDIVRYMKQTIQFLLDNDVQVGMIWFPVASDLLESLPRSYVAMANELKENYPDQFIFFNFEGVQNFGTTSVNSANIPQDYRRDGLHFNQAGYKNTAEYIIQKIREADDTLADSQAGGASSVIIRG